jgi:hypothetical protein
MDDLAIVMTWLTKDNYDTQNQDYSSDDGRGGLSGP